MSSVEQFESPWLELAEVMIKAAPGVAGAAVDQVDPLMPPVVTNALGAILQGQSEQMKQLRASVNRLATFCAWQLSKRFDSLFSVA